jgi:ParB family transcriptional regulator, chromosome partitioning protein
VTAPPRRRGLGRGLDALLSSSAHVAAAPGAGDDSLVVVELSLEAIDPNPEQPRTHFDEDSLDELTESIRTHGILQPVVVERDGHGGFRLIAGERRVRAARRAGLAAVPALVRPASESARHSLELALVENLQRTDLSPLEEATAFSRLADTFGLTHEAIALRIGRSRAAVTNAIRLLALPPPVQEHLAARRLSTGHAKAILGLGETTSMERLAERVVVRGLTVRQTEQAVATLLEKERRAPEPLPVAALTTQADPVVYVDPEAGAADAALVRALEDALGTPVRLERRRRGGRLVIDFFDDTQLDALYRRLGGADL